MGSVLGLVASVFAGKKAIDSLKPKVENPDTPATPAVAAPDAEVKRETGVDTTGRKLKRKARGKKGLIIQPNNLTGGGTVGGTGLNI